MADLKALLANVDTLAAQVNEVRPFDDETEQRIRQKLRLDWNYHSNAIEGNTLSLGETRAFLLHGITAQGKPFRDYLDIHGHRKAIDYLEEFVRQEEDLTEAYIRELHKVLLVEPYEMDALTPDGRPTKRRIEIGQYKTQPNSVRTSTGAMHFYASPQETPARMGDLMAWYREVTQKGEIHPVVLAATFHFKFVEIHPFDDGNGRMSRLLMNLLLMRNRLVPIIVPTERKSEYILALEQADAGEVEPFIEFIGERVVDSLELYLKAARGESLEELSDIDKRIALFEKQLSGEEGKHEEERFLQSQQFLFAEVVKPFLLTLDATLQKIGRLFRETSTVVVQTHSGIQHNELPNKPLDKTLNQAEHFIQKNILRELQVVTSFDGLKTRPDVVLKTRTGVSFEQSQLEIQFIVLPLEKVIEVTIPVSRIPEPAKLNEMVIKISNRLLDLIGESAQENPND
ncbi:MAG: Fic family protein [Chloroflexota bacterium]